MVREPNMTRMIQGLQTSGLVAREVDKSDRRAFHLVLTDQGKALMDGVADRIAGLEDRVLGSLSGREARGPAVLPGPHPGKPGLTRLDGEDAYR